MKYTADDGYKEYNHDLQLYEARQSTLYLSQAFSEMKFKTMSQYKQAKSISISAKNIISDIEYIKNNTLSQQVTLSESTHIDYNAKSVQQNQQTIAPVFKYDSKDSSRIQFQLGYQYLQRASQNVVGKEYQVRGYSDTTSSQQLQKAIQDYQNLGVLADEKRMESSVDIPLILEKTMDIAIPRLLLFANFMYHRQAPVIEGAIKATGNILNNIAEQANNISSKLFEWGDIMSNPFGQILNLVEGIGSVMTFSQSIMYSIQGNVFSEVGGGILKAIFRDIDKDDEDTVKSSFLGFMTTILSQLGGVINGLMNQALQGIQLSLNMYISIMSSIFNILKAIIKTSPVFEQILNYISLQMAVFFLPFFSEFGEPILNAIMSIFNWIINEPKRLVDSFDQSTGTQKEIQGFVNLILTSLDNIISNIDTEKFYEKMDELIIAVKQFMTDFKDTFIKHADEINQFLGKGVEALGIMAKDNIIGGFISIGNTALETMLSSTEKIAEAFKTVFEFAKLGLEVFSHAMGGFYNIINFIIVTMGALAGAVVGFDAWQIATAVSLGIQSIGIGAFIAGGAVAGGGIGEQAWLALEGYIKKDWIEYYKNYTIPSSSDIPKFASGGKIYKKNGGQVGIIAEQGEGEWAIPKSKVKLFRGNNNVIIRINGNTYNKTQIDSAVRELESTMIFPFDSN